ncbi:hypothetical protein C8Q75DRAFT_747814 [Abortiporus biennis]|nr:hypothetical protein C8Q75DRAFT_747814 [Abortiporus biennis]
MNLGAGTWRDILPFAQVAEENFLETLSVFSITYRGVQEEEEDAEWKGSLMDLLQPLTNIKHWQLCSLEVNLSRLVSDDDNQGCQQSPNPITSISFFNSDVLKCSQSWPSLRTLTILDNYSVGPHPTIGCLLPLAENCPNLESLQISLSYNGDATTGVTAKPSNLNKLSPPDFCSVTFPLVYHSMTSLFIDFKENVDADDHDVSLLADYVNRVFPLLEYRECLPISSSSSSDTRFDDSYDSDSLFIPSQKSRGSDLWVRMVEEIKKLNGFTYMLRDDVYRMIGDRPVLIC